MGEGSKIAKKLQLHMIFERP